MLKDERCGYIILITKGSGSLVRRNFVNYYLFAGKFTCDFSGNARLIHDN